MQHAPASLRLPNLANMTEHHDPGSGHIRTVEDNLILLVAAVIDRHAPALEHHCSAAIGADMAAIQIGHANLIGEVIAWVVRSSPGHIPERVAQSGKMF